MARPGPEGSERTDAVPPANLPDVSAFLSAMADERELRSPEPVRRGCSEPAAVSCPSPDAPSDLVLLRSYRSTHDMDAFHSILQRHQGDLLRLATALLGDAEAAKDAVQECFLRLVQGADKLIATAARGGHDGIGGWLSTVLRNHCLDLLRRRSAVRFIRLDQQPSDNGAAVGREAPEVPEVREEPAEPGPDDGGLVWSAVAALPHLERAAIVLRYRDGLSYQDIATRLGKSATHVGVLLYQALGRLRRSPALRAVAAGGGA